MKADHELVGGQPCPGRDFTDPRHHQGDFALVQRLYQLLVTTSRPPEEGQPLSRQEGQTAEGRAFRMFRIAPELPNRFAAVVFCGCIRSDYPMEQLMEADDRLVAAFPRARGLYAYVSMERSPGQWGNLALFQDADCRSEWSKVEPHEGAVSISPQCYHNVRLHLGEFSESRFHIQKSYYLDYDSDPNWRGFRLTDVSFDSNRPADPHPS